MEVSDGWSGSFPYMAPEACEDPYRFSFASDRWSMGAIGFELFTRGDRFCPAQTRKKSIEFINSPRSIDERLRRAPSFAIQILAPFLNADWKMRPDLLNFFSRHEIWPKYGINFLHIQESMYFYYILVIYIANLCNAVYLVEYIAQVPYPLKTCEIEVNTRPLPLIPSKPMTIAELDEKTLPYLGFYYSKEDNLKATGMTTQRFSLL